MVGDAARPRWAARFPSARICAQERPSLGETRFFPTGPHAVFVDDPAVDDEAETPGKQVGPNL